MKQRLVSVIIPTYNRGHLAVRATQSVLAQTYADVEVLVVDDGSKDDTRAVVTKAFEGNARVRYLSKPNGGVSSARNLGIREARGEFVGLLDSDDTWLPNKLALQLECLRLFPDAGMVWTDMTAVDEVGKILHERFLRKMYSAYRYFPTARDLFSKGREAQVQGVAAFVGDIFSPMVLGNLVHTSTVLLRSERVKRVGFFDEKVRTGEDYPFHLTTCREGPVAYVDAVTIHYTIGAADALTSSDKLIEVAKGFLKTYQNTLETEASQITLPKALLRERLSDAYAWVGEEHLRAGLDREARGYFLKSLQACPSRLSLLKSLAESALPRPVRTTMKALKRRLFR